MLSKLGSKILPRRVPVVLPSQNKAVPLQTQKWVCRSQSHPYPYVRTFHHDSLLHSSNNNNSEGKQSDEKVVLTLDSSKVEGTRPEPEFSIGDLLKRAGITDPLKLRKYTFFLERKGIDRNNVNTLTEVKLEKWAQEFDEKLQKDEKLRKNYVKNLGLEYDEKEEYSFDLGADATIIYEAAQSFGKNDLGQIIDAIYLRRPDWRCVLQFPETPRVNLGLDWVGRTQELQQLEEFATDNIKEYLMQSTLKQNYRIPLVHGGLGVGKSRTVVESNRILKQKIESNDSSFSLINSNKPFQDRIANIYIDFSITDELSPEENNPRLVLGLRLASHFFFGVGIRAFLSQLEMQGIDRKYFTFDNVMMQISKRFTSDNRHVLITIHMDEFPKVPVGSLGRGMISALADHMINNHSLRVCILPQLSGTSNEASLVLTEDFSIIKPQALLLQPLPDAHQLAKRTLKEIQQTSMDNIAIYHQALDALGGVPRFFEFFTNQLKWLNPEVRDQHDKSVVLSIVLRKVVDQICRTYFLKDWQTVLGHSEVGVRTLLLWGLSGTRVTLTQSLNGSTVGGISRTGILMLEAAHGYTNEYTIHMPLVLLRALNLQLNIPDIEDEYLDSIKKTDDREFEKIMAAIRVLRQNLLVGMGRKEASYKELYPGALGYSEDLEFTVPLRRLSIVYAAGSGYQNAIHTKDLKEIPVQGCATPFINPLQTGCFIHNVPLSSSFDGLIVHSSAIIEGSQPKSSGDITNRLEPKGRNSLDLSLIWREYEKVMDSHHKEFYKKAGSDTPRFTLFIVSNKLFKDVDDVSKQIISGRYNESDKNQLPKGVCVIHHGTFKQYAGSFAHCGLFVPLENAKS